MGKKKEYKEANRRFLKKLSFQEERRKKKR